MDNRPPNLGPVKVKLRQVRKRMKHLRGRPAPSDDPTYRRVLDVVRDYVARAGRHGVVHAATVVEFIEAHEAQLSRGIRRAYDQVIDEIESLKGQVAAMIEGCQRLLGDVRRDGNIFGEAENQTIADTENRDEIRRSGFSMEGDER